MTQDQIALIRANFALVAPNANAVGMVFYDHLFALDPALRPMFHGPIEAQAAKLMQVLAFAVANLEKPDALLPPVRALGQRHVGYGVVPAHYQTVGAALLDTLAAGLGDAFTPEAKAAWTEAYTVLATEMQDAASGVAAPH
jgi:hemoglobin-like flavoprotein